MLTQGPAPDRKCKLNISSTLTLPPLLDCLICARNSMSILLLLQMLGDGMVIFLSRYGWGVKGWVLPYRFWGFLLKLLCFVLSYSLFLFWVN